MKTFFDPILACNFVHDSTRNKFQLAEYRGKDTDLKKKVDELSS